MQDIVGIIKQWQDSDGALCAKLELQCSTVSDLPEIGDVVGGFKVQAGSIAQLVQANTFVTLDDDTDYGTWYPEQD